MILGLETSCDETAAALVTLAGEIRSSVVASQAELHARFGGVVPEVASRRHLELVTPVVRDAFDDARRGYTLEVRVSNETAIALYERLGFESRGLRRGYYTDNREDALIMWKDPVQE